MTKKELNIFKLLSQKPWEASQAAIDNQHDGKTLDLSKAKLGVRTVMVVSSVIFSLFVVSYSDRMLVHDWRSLNEPWLLWINTIILIFTSFIFHKAKVLSDKNEFEKAKNYLFLVGFFETFACTQIISGMAGLSFPVDHIKIHLLSLRLKRNILPVASVAVFKLKSNEISFFSGFNFSTGKP